MTRLSPLLVLLLTAGSVFAVPPSGPVRPLTGSERDSAMKRLREAADRFSIMSREYGMEMKSVVLREVLRRRTFLEKSYNKKIDEIDVAQRQRRLEAIAALKRFVGRYKDHPDHTPDAMMRLAELYYEKALVDSDEASAHFDRDRKLYERGKIPSPPVRSTPDFSESARLYAELIRRFKTYRLRDAAFYLRGYVMYRSENERGALDAWLALAREYPKSKYTPEALMRIGEYYFDYGQWKAAEKYYTLASAYPKSKFYDMVLYKLAWTYYQMFDYDRAINGFRRLIAHYDGKKDKKSELGAQLRIEAIQYLARSLADDDWDGDGDADADAGVDRALKYVRGGEAFEVEILEEYAKSLYELHEDRKYKEAARVYRVLVDRNPTNPKNPELHERLIESLDLSGDLVNAAKAREELVERYGKTSAWYRANIQNAGATSKAERLVEVALRQRGKFHHAAAQKLRAQGLAEGDKLKLVKAKEEYEAAVAAYRRYLAEYPKHRETYETRYLLAEALYWSGHYLAASREYGTVRDFPGKTEHREASAYSAIKAHEKHMQERIRAGRLPKKLLALNPEDPPPEEQAKGAKVRRVKALPIPEVHAPWVKHSDAYLTLRLKHEGEPDFPIQQSYRVALMYYNFRHFPEARRRFEAIIARWPKTRESSFAARVIINSYKIENDWTNIEKWTDRVVRAGIGRPEDVAKLRKEIKLWHLGVRFDKAMALYKAKDYVKAAKEFERIAQEEKKDQVALKAFFNAGMAYQLAKHWGDAARVFERIVVESRFKGSKFREDALLNLADNNYKFFDFDKAVRYYLALVRGFPDSPKSSYALYQSALIQEMVGNLSDAARIYQDYANRPKSKEADAMRAQFRAGMVFEKMKDAPGQIRIWRDFITRFGKSSGADERVVEAHLRLGDLYRGLGDWKNAKLYYERTIAEYKARAMKPETTPAGFAAKAQFELLERTFDVYRRVTLQGNLAAMGRAIQRKQALIKEMETAYVAMFDYKAFGWTIAAYLRIGQLYELFARMLYDAPDPQGLSDAELDEYKNQIENLGLKWENVAIERYEECVRQARRLKVVNEWTLAALKAANKYKPAQYPLFKAEKRAYDFGSDNRLPLGPAKGAKDGRTPAVDPDEPKAPDGEKPIDVPVPGLDSPPAKGGDVPPAKGKTRTPPAKGDPKVPEPEPEPEPTPEPDGGIS